MRRKLAAVLAADVVGYSRLMETDAEGTLEALTTARATLEHIEAQLGSVHRNVARIQALVLHVSVCDALDDTASAEASLNIALDLAQDGQIIRPFVEQGRPMAKLLKAFLDRDDETLAIDPEFGLRILAALSSSLAGDDTQRSSIDSRIRIETPENRAFQPLTTREMQILQMLATDRTPAEIAAQNVVSISTVRSQIASIYRKLDENNRIEAVNRGRELNIV